MTSTASRKPGRAGVEGTPAVSRRSTRRESYPDLAPPVKHASFSGPADWPDWTDAEVVELGQAPDGVSWPEVIDGARYAADPPRDNGEEVRRA